jgi:hypothetical protein
VDECRGPDRRLRLPSHQQGRSRSVTD